MVPFEFSSSHSKKTDKQVNKVDQPESQKSAYISDIPRSLQSSEGIKQLHHSFGNQAVGRLLKQHAIIQPKLKVGAANDKYEQQADRIAQRVISGMIGKTNLGESINPIVQRSTEDSGVNVSPNFDNSLKKSTGKPLPKDICQNFESKFSQNFSNIRVHDNALSSQLCEEIHANAFTHANNIYFNKGQFQPQTIQGKKLIAHELVHTIQQKTNNSINRDVIQRNVLEDLSNGKERSSENIKSLLEEYKSETAKGTYKNKRSGRILKVDSLLDAYIKQLEVHQSLKEDAKRKENIENQEKADSIKRLNLLLLKSQTILTKQILDVLRNWWDDKKHKKDIRRDYVEKFFSFIEKTNASTSLNYVVNKQLLNDLSSSGNIFQPQDNVDEKDEVFGEISERIGDPAEYIDEEYLKEDAGPDGLKKDVEIGRVHELELNAVKGLEMAGGSVDAIASFAELVSIWKNDPSGNLMKILKSTLPFSKLFSASVQIGDAAEKVHLFNEYQAYDKAGGENEAHQLAIGTAFAADVIDTSKTFAETFYNPIKYIYDRKQQKKKHNEYLEESEHFNIAITMAENATKTAQGAVKAAYGFRAAFEGESIQKLSDGATGLDIAVQSINLIHNVLDGFSAFKKARDLTRVMYDDLPDGYGDYTQNKGFWIFKYKKLIKNTEVNDRIEELSKKDKLDFEEKVELNKLQGVVLGSDFKNIKKSIGYTKVLDGVQNVIKIIGDALSLNPATAIVGLPMRLAVSISKLARKFFRQYKKGFRKSTQQKTAAKDEDKRFKRAKMLVYMSADYGDMRKKISGILVGGALKQNLLEQERKKLQNINPKPTSEIEKKENELKNLSEKITMQTGRYKELNTLGKRLKMLITSIGVNVKTLSLSKTPEEMFKTIMDKQKL